MTARLAALAFYAAAVLAVAVVVAHAVGAVAGRFTGVGM